MPSVFRMTVRYLDPVPAFHGRGDGGDPEWPPSPLRLFQALVCAAARRWRDGPFTDYAIPALRWLEQQPDPVVVAPNIQATRTGFRMYVPNNAGDLVTSAWARGNEDTKFSTLNVEKDVLPTRLAGEAVHYLFPLFDDDAEFAKYRETLQTAARSITHLGWGVDMVAADAVVISQEEADRLPGERWEPVPVGGTALRVPRSGTLNDLMKKHEAFLGRLSDGGFKPVRPLSKFQIVGYRRSTEPLSRPFVAFQILDAEASGFQAFDTPRRCRDVAAWLRNATGAACAGWPFGDIATFVHGHDSVDSTKQLKGDSADERFLYLPVPSIERRGDLGNHTGAIRRVMIAAPPGFQAQIDWVRRRMSGQDLIWQDEAMGMLTILPTSDWVLKQYIGESETWSTVTPVIWPGYDDRNQAKAEKLLRKSFVDAGLSQQIVDGIQELEWRPVGFRAGLDLAGNYARPDKLTGSLYHVRVRFTHPVKGPLAVGAGRYRGLGLFAMEGRT